MQFKSYGSALDAPEYAEAIELVSRPFVALVYSLRDRGVPYSLIASALLSTFASLCVSALPEDEATKSVRECLDLLPQIYKEFAEAPAAIDLSGMVPAGQA